MLRRIVILFLLLCIVGCSDPSKRERPTTRRKTTVSLGVSQQVVSHREKNPRGFRLDYSRISLWWDKIPDAVELTCLATGDSSNIAKSSYVGPESCEKCHQENFDSWSEHPHRWMNALSEGSTVKGDFSGKAKIQYLGGEGTFYQEGDDYRMRLERRGVVRVYDINQTIGSRFFQYYVGKQIEGPEESSHRYYHDDHVLPFGYWLDRQEWVPVVHVSDRITCDSYTNDPYVAANSVSYTICNSCHTTFAMGDRLIRDMDILGRGSPFTLHVGMAIYLQGERPELVEADKRPSEFGDAKLDHVMGEMSSFKAPEEAVTLGISCEACHFGLKDHVEGTEKKPTFHPHDPNLFVHRGQKDKFFGKSDENVNWSCSRCHVGPRPQLAAGMATWNSTEASDAFRGSCYSEMTCIDCHDPHKAIGSKWTKTPEQDDASCLKCHSDLASDAAIQAHTHHAPKSAGSHCMDCHMPRINEGLQDVVRTHMIHSPTNKEMVTSNQPNACNLCHTEKSINWTLQYLNAWYGAKYDERVLTQTYPDRSRSAALGWLKSENEAVRLIAADALTRKKNYELLPEVINALDDHFLLNRQFASIGIEQMLNIDLSDFGYRFYMTPEERKVPIDLLRRKYGKANEKN